MKKNLLILATTLLTATGAIAQFTQDNSPSIGESVQLYMLDSSAVTYDEVVGQGVVWDYSAVEGVNGAQKTISVVAATDTDYDTTFTTSDQSIIIEDYFMTYYTDPTADEKISNGFVYINSDANLAELDNIVVPFEIKECKAYEYPAGLGDEMTDEFSGTASVKVDLGGQVLVLEPEMNGVVTTKVDGIGTLKLAGNDYENVYRYRIQENAAAYVADLGDTAKLNRIQYEYYDFSVSNLPIFVKSSLQFSLGAMTMIDVNITLSKEDPATAGITEDQLTKVEVYPNPTSDLLNIDATAIEGDISMTLVDELGREVYATILNSNTTTVNVASLQSGVYFVKMQQGNNIFTKKVLVK